MTRESIVLEKGLQLKTVTIKSDAMRLSKFNGLIHGPEAGKMAYGACGYLPGKTNRHFGFI